MAQPDWKFLVRQNERILSEMASLRDDVSVLTAIVQRVDGTVTALLTEIRAVHGQVARPSCPAR